MEFSLNTLDLLGILTILFFFASILALGYGLLISRSIGIPMITLTIFGGILILNAIYTEKELESKIANLHKKGTISYKNQEYRILEINKYDKTVRIQSLDNNIIIYKSIHELK